MNGKKQKGANARKKLQKEVGVSHIYCSIGFNNSWKRAIRLSYMRGESKEQKAKTMESM